LLREAEFCAALGEDDCTGDDAVLVWAVVDDEGFGLATGRGFGRGRADMGVSGEQIAWEIRFVAQCFGHSLLLIMIHHGLLVSNIQKIKGKARSKSKGKVVRRRFADRD